MPKRKDALIIAAVLVVAGLLLLVSRLMPKTNIAEKVADGAKDVADKAADTAKAGSRIAKLNIEIATERDNMKKTYLEIGKLYYDTHKDDPEGFFIQLCEEIALAEKNIANKQAEIDALKADDDDSIEVEFEEIIDEDDEDDGLVETVEDIVEEVIDDITD